MNRRTMQVVFFAAIAAVAITFWIQAQQIPYPSNVFPRAAIAGVVILCVLCAAQTALQPEAVQEGALAAHSKAEFTPAVAIGTGLSVLYALAVNVLGFYISTFLFLTIMFNLRATPPRILGRASAAFAATAITYLIFARALGVQTPKGLLF